MVVEDMDGSKGPRTMSRRTVVPPPPSFSLLSLAYKYPPHSLGIRYRASTHSLKHSFFLSLSLSTPLISIRKREISIYFDSFSLLRSATNTPCSSLCFSERMSVDVLPNSSSALMHLPKLFHSWPAPPPPLPAEYQFGGKNNEVLDEDRRVEAPKPQELDLWNAIQSEKTESSTLDAAAPYVHPLLRRSSRMMSQKSLEVCTESLGSETGSADFSSFDDIDCSYSEKEIEAETQDEHDKLEYYEQETAAVEAHRVVRARKELTSVNYHCSTNRRSPPRSFPPPLPSISRRDGPCLHMRPHRRDGRLVVEAVAVPSQNYLHAQREGGRLLLSFIEATEPLSGRLAADKYSQVVQKAEQQVENDDEVNGETTKEKEVVQLKEEDYICYAEEEDEKEEDEEEEEVEVVDRGTVIEVKVSIQPQQQSSATKVLRSSVVINKFVGDTPMNPSAENNEIKNSNNYSTPTSPTSMRPVQTTTTTNAAAAVAVASSLSASTDGAQWPQSDNKLLFTSKRRNREELLHNMQRCNQFRLPLFIWEPYCIATS